MDNKTRSNEVAKALLRLLDIPSSYYEKAKDRYQSMAEWFHRDDSTIVNLDPSVYPQGSFRLGTVIRPLLPSDGYDLDIVCKIEMEKTSASQKQVKVAVGVEVASYSVAQNFKKAPEEGRRCWKQQYQDEVSFHMDILPAVPESSPRLFALERLGVPTAFAKEMLGITDRESENYSTVDPNWPSSNPRGYALWFEDRMNVGGIAVERRRELVANLAYASIDEVPAYALRTPLQRVVQLLKRHRDVMFKNDPDGKPISIIITTLAARAYDGEKNIAEAVVNVLEKMKDHVGKSRPRIPNPVDPGEDFADRWTPILEVNFNSWVDQAQRDFRQIFSDLSADNLADAAKHRFSVVLGQQELRALAPASVSVAEKNVNVSTGTKPWSDRRAV